MKKWHLFVFLMAPVSNFCCLLTAQPSFRSIQVGVEFQEIESNHDRSEKECTVTICENQPWGLTNCFSTPTNQSSITFRDLRMSTTYTLGTLLEGGDTPRLKNAITLQTDGFKVLATSCQSDKTQILVETGPFFGGIMSLEAPSKDMNNGSKVKCDLLGNPNSSQTQYLFTILHETCLGLTLINHTFVEANLIVQESLAIITSTTKRFKVSCVHQPSVAFTIKAGLTMPNKEVKNNNGPNRYHIFENQDNLIQGLQTSKVKFPSPSLSGADTAEDENPEGQQSDHIVRKRKKLLRANNSFFHEVTSSTFAKPGESTKNSDSGHMILEAKASRLFLASSSKDEDPHESSRSIFTILENEPYPISHVIMMAILVTSAAIGSIATLLWIRHLLIQRRQQTEKNNNSKQLWTTCSAGTSTQDSLNSFSLDEPIYENVAASV